jgi:hypothetical protein
MIIQLFLLGSLLQISQAFQQVQAFRSKGHHGLRLPTTFLSSSSYPSIDSDEEIGGRNTYSHVSMLDESLRKLTGKGVCERMEILDNSADPSTIMDSREAVYNKICLNDRFVLISHGTEDNPIYNFVNVAGLEAFVRTWDNFKIPSRESVVLQSKDEALRIELMNKVTNTGFVEGATGIRVRGDGKYIRLVDAVVS